MLRTFKNPVINRTLANAQLAALSAIPGATLMDAPKLILLKVMPEMTPDTDYADLTEADFSGYAAAVAGTLSGPVEEASDTQSMLCTKTFVGAAPLATPNSIVGAALVNAGKTAWYVAEKFAEPVGIVEAYDFLTVEASVPLHMKPAL